VPGAIVDGGERKVVTNNQGRALVTGLNGVNSRVQVTLDELIDVHLQAPPSTVEFHGRPGRVQTIAYPLTPTSEAALRIVSWKSGRLIGLSAVRVALISADGKTASASTEFDGSVHFDALRAGRYRVELDAEQSSRLRMRLKHALEFEVRADQGTLDDMTAEVVFDPAPARIAANGDNQR
jgi:hypothetical protein